MEFLLPYITGLFENTYEGFSKYLQEQIEQNKIVPKIRLEDRGGFDSPKVLFGMIILNESFMCALWSFCYYYFVMHEEYVVPYYNEGKRVKNEKLDQAEGLYHWGIGLKEAYTRWPEGMPNPTLHDANSTVNTVNQIFLYAMDFIMCHEFAHIDKAPQQGTPIEQEQEADDVAFDLLLRGRDGKNDTIIYLGVIMALACLLLLNPSAKDSETHPSSISRLDAFMRKIDLPEEHKLWCITTVVLIDWSMRNELGYVFPQESDTFKSRYEEMMRIVHNG